MAESFKTNTSGFAAYATADDLVIYRDWRLIADLVRDDDRRATLDELVGSNEIQSITITAVGGTFTVSFDGQTTSAIAFDATNATLQSALEALSSIGAGSVSVSGGPGATSAFSIEFIGLLENSDQPALTTNAAGLSGVGASAAVSVLTKGGGADNRVERALKTATGMIESEIFHGGRYSRADMKRLLVEIEDPDDNDEEKFTMARDLLRQITCDLAFWVLIKRRKPDVNGEKIAGVKEALEYLVRLRNGEAIFPFQETTDAGVMDYAMLDPRYTKSNYESKNPFRTSSGSRRMFGQRANGL